MLRLLIGLSLIFTLLGCDKPSNNQLRIGTISGPETDLVKVAQQVAKNKYGLNIKIVEFTDYNLPNEALADGSLDANVFQHLPYLLASVKAHGYDFIPIGKTFIYPMAIYSDKFKSLNQLPNKSIIAIPNDPSNEARALYLLQQAGLIQLKNTHSFTLNDIAANPHQFIFKELDAAHLPRILEDVGAAVINTTYALPAGLTLKQHSLYVEKKDSPYANLIIIKRHNNKEPQLLLFVKAFNSPEVKQKAKDLFGEAAIPAW